MNQPKTGAVVSLCEAARLCFKRKGELMCLLKHFSIDKSDVLYYNASNQTVTFVKRGEKLETKGI